MSIEVSNLVKQYGRQNAVDDLSFSVKKNEIVGFLGPNGAGKSTTLKIATGYLAPTAGTVKISGLDVSQHPIEIKKRIGYLPEHNPLYLDMFVHEYLHFSGRFFNVRGKKLRERTNKVIEMCQLGVEQNKKIGQLSKGYRQRVGLAQALLHEPEVLILDEPTTGLDPNQIIEVRELIKTISAERTVLFSTHIMQEVQAICDRVVIINDGQLVADDSLSHILAGSAKQILEIQFETPVDQDKLYAFSGVENIVGRDNNVYEIEMKSLEDARPEMMKHIATLGLPLIGIKQKENTMEEVFNTLTGAKEHV
jgi:gliding motility-associated transport system ATP-binding protein